MTWVLLLQQSQLNKIIAIFAFSGCILMTPFDILDDDASCHSIWNLFIRLITTFD
jgi:hypothetical protein